MAGVAAAIAGVTRWMTQLEPAPPVVERSTVWVDTVRRGPMVRQIKAMGTLVPEEVLWIPAPSDGRVERIHVRPGVVVKKDTIVLELTNPELQLAAFDAEWQLKMAEANYKDLKVRLESQQLDQKANTARIQAEYNQAKLQADRDEALLKLGLKPDLDFKLSKSRAEELDNRFQIEQKRLAISAESVDAQLAAQRVQMEKLRAAWALKRKQVEMLKVRAGTPGVLEQVAVEVGQQVQPGAILAKVAEPGRLKAELRIPETQAKDVAAGQSVEVDTRNGIVEGTVARIDPVVQNGTVKVEVRLVGNLPKGARSELTVDGLIEVERVRDTLLVGRPAFGQPNTATALFRLEAGGKRAVRTAVKLGRASVNIIEVVDGLREGDQVILSDLSAWENQNRIMLN
jgi:HlyD family secretion protein